MTESCFKPPDVGQFVIRRRQLTVGCSRSRQESNVAVEAFSSQLDRNVSPAQPALGSSLWETWHCQQCLRFRLSGLEACGPAHQETHVARAQRADDPGAFLLRLSLLTNRPFRHLSPCTSGETDTQKSSITMYQRFPCFWSGLPIFEVFKSWLTLHTLRLMQLPHLFTPSKIIK